tara:strand:+ start:184 stop:423 length:240 start_codon:yes stop_codon:yes gene_type:complete
MLMDTTYQTSVLLVDVVQTLTQVGQLVVHLSIPVVEVLQQTEEILEWEIMLVYGTYQDTILTEVGVIVITMLIDPLLHL